MNDTNGSCRSGWTDDEKRALAAVTFPLIEMQKVYGRKLDAKLIMQGWQIKFAGRFSVAQLLYALDKYTDKHDDFPSPSNLIEILEPEEPKITETQFIEAQNWQKRNDDYSEYSVAADTIRQYKMQNGKKQEVFRIESETVRQLALGSINRINQIAEQKEKSPTPQKQEKANEKDKETKKDETISYRNLSRKEWKDPQWSEYVDEAKCMLSFAKEAKLVESEQKYWEEQITKREAERNEA